LAADLTGRSSTRQPPSPPLPITRVRARARVRQTLECLEVIDVHWGANNSFTSQYSQDWFLFVNFFHHLDHGFYLDIGANDPKELSNTWFLDVCLGWDGVCVEADPGLGRRLRRERSCKVVNTCVDSAPRTMALQAAGIAVGHVVPVADRTPRGVVLQCVTLLDIIQQFNLHHIDFFSLDVEDHEMHVLQTLPEEDDGLTIDVILVENEKSSKTPGVCHHPNLLRYPFWLRGYALLNLHGTPQGDDLWIRSTNPRLWRRSLTYPRGHPLMERTRRKSTEALLPRRYRTPAILDALSSPD
jgi:FkbM family methyltransferase